MKQRFVLASILVLGEYWNSLYLILTPVTATVANEVE